MAAAWRDCPTSFLMLTNKIKRLAATRLKVARLEKAIAAERGRELAELPARYGFTEVGEFLAAVRAAAGGRGAAKPRGQKRRKRAVITEAKRARVLRLVKAGKTGNQIAVAAGISLPSVNAIKKKAGLTKARK